MKNLSQYKLKLGDSEYTPLVIGGMGVDISTEALALVAAKNGSIGHISDAMITAVADRHYKTHFVSQKLNDNKHLRGGWDKSEVAFDLQAIEEATRIYAQGVMSKKKGTGAIFANCMEKLTMSHSKNTLKARLIGLLDGGIDGITLSAGLHLSSFAMMQDHRRFHEAKLGIIVSSARALKVFILKSKRTKRLPDFVVVEGPLAGGHLGFSNDDLEKHDLKELVREVLAFQKKEGLDIPVIAAGGIFTGSDAIAYLELGASAVQVATRFTITKECGLPDAVKQAYLKANREDIVVNCVSPTGYPMRMLRQSPALGKGVRPNCESLGYLLTNSGTCSYIDAYTLEIEKKDQQPVSVKDKICLCTAMKGYQCWTCGSNTDRLKETAHQLPNGDYELPSAQHICDDYLYSTDNKINVPRPENRTRKTASDAPIAVSLRR
ncbi:MAG: nitronate monooxygenase [Proteobacteria bacterium]|nr:nitronate monooxygenase [Pseudomonadota bacterium]